MHWTLIWVNTREIGQTLKERGDSPNFYRIGTELLPTSYSTDQIVMASITQLADAATNGTDLLGSLVRLVVLIVLTTDIFPLAYQRSWAR